MTRKQQLFIDYYTCQSNRNTFLNASESGRKAGYAENAIRTTTSELLAHPNIKPEIEKRLKVIQDGLHITDEGIIKLLWDIALSAGKPSDRVSALRELASIRGMKTIKFEEKKEWKPAPVFYNRIDISAPSPTKNKKSIPKDRQLQLRSSSGMCENQFSVDK